MDAVVRECTFFAQGLELFRKLPPRSQRAVVQTELPFASGLSVASQRDSRSTTQTGGAVEVPRGGSSQSGSLRSITGASAVAREPASSSTSLIFSNAMRDSALEVERVATAAICAAVAAGPMPGPQERLSKGDAPAAAAPAAAAAESPSPGRAGLSVGRGGSEHLPPVAVAAAVADTADTLFRGIVDVALQRRTVTQLVRQVRHARSAIRPGVAESMGS